MKVPEILLSGNTKAIDQWREDQAYQRTQERRPDLLSED
jgi:tRNA (guanine37-N1)-methyltransferase